MDEGIRARLGLPAADPNLARHDLRVFGAGLAAFLTIIAGLAWRKGSGAAPWELSSAAACALLAWLQPAVLKPVYKPWMKAAGAVGKANTFLVMALIYYLIITPYALVIRLMGRDLLDEKLRDRESYWRPKEPPLGPESYRNQF